MVFTKDFGISGCTHVHTAPQTFLCREAFFSTFVPTVAVSATHVAAAAAAAVSVAPPPPLVEEAEPVQVDAVGTLPKLSDVFRMTMDEFAEYLERGLYVPSAVPPLSPPQGGKPPGNVRAWVSVEGRTEMGLKTTKDTYSMQSLASWRSPKIALRKFGFDSVAPFHVDGALHDCMYYFLCCWPRETNQEDWAALGVVCDLTITHDIYPTSSHACASK